MYNDTIKVENKIITKKDLLEIFEKINDELEENKELSKQEKEKNEKIELKDKNWKLKNFDGNIKCTFNFYDSTNVTVDNYNDFLTIYNNRLHEVKDMFFRYHIIYFIQNSEMYNMVSQSISLLIYENRMEISVNISSKDENINEIYKLIKEKIINAPKRYSRIIEKKNSIKNKIIFSKGIIPSLIICSLLIFIPIIRQIYGMTLVFYPFLVIALAFTIGNIIIGPKLDKLYENIVPKKEYAGHDKNYNSIYKDNINEYKTKSEIIIGKNINNIKNRNEIIKLEKKCSKNLKNRIIIACILVIIIDLISILI